MSRPSQIAAAEALESRRLMDATLLDGHLTITGTEAKDVIVVSVDASDSQQLAVDLNKSHLTFPRSEVQDISINSLGGNDKVVISEKVAPLYIGVTVDAGDGNDNVVTGSGNDILMGGKGNDNLSSGDGDDFVYGNDGNDKIDGGAANDYIDGGNGNDSLVGGSDNDTLLAGDGKDKVSAGTGDDNVDGGTGKDSIKTGDGTDAIAEDTDNQKEVKDSNAADSHYTIAELTDDIAALHEQVVPGSTVFRCELTDDGYMTLYYRFGEDPTSYKTVLNVSQAIATGTLSENVELVSREVSLTELRSPAVAIFNARTPNLGILSFKSTGNGYAGEMGMGAEVIRYRDVDGSIKVTTTNDVAWTLDEAEGDLDNDGLFDHSGGGGDHQSQGGIPLDPSWTAFPSGDGRTLYQDGNGNVFEPREDGLYYPHQNGDGNGGGGH